MSEDIKPQTPPAGFPKPKPTEPEKPETGDESGNGSGNGSGDGGK